jgi:hypothetical protein
MFWWGSMMSIETPWNNFTSCYFTKAPGENVLIIIVIVGWQIPLPLLLRFKRLLEDACNCLMLVYISAFSLWFLLQLTFLFLLLKLFIMQGQIVCTFCSQVLCYGQVHLSIVFTFLPLFGLLSRQLKTILNE